MAEEPPPELVSVVRRWDPGTLADLDRPDPADRHPCVSVLGLPGTGAGELAARLRFAAPGMRFAEHPDPQATVVLMVLDASGPLGREELDLLRSGTAEAWSVTFALTGTDAHRGWEAVRERDVALLADHAPRFAGAVIHPVSAGGDECLTALRHELAAALERDRARVPDAPGARLRAAANRTREQVRSTATALRSDEDTAELRARRVALIADRDGVRAESAATLRRLTALARVDLVHDVGDRVRALSATARSRIDRADRSELTRFPEWLRAQVVGLTADLDEAAGERLDRIAAQVSGSAGDAGRAGEAVVGPPNRTPPVLDGPEPRHRGVEDRMMILVGASAGLGLGRLVMAPMSTVPALNLASIPVTLLVGGVAAWWLTRARGHLADRNHLRQWVAESLAQVRAALEQRALGRLVDTEARVAEAALAAHRRRAAEVDERLAGLDRQLRECVTRTSGRLAACERDLAVLDRYLGEGRPEPEPAPGRVRPSI
ncbi:hypothetical protein FK531_10250 [Rhodococcus spelaei]|uniref:Uncharacterized protein n=1 Tax=Rhodococcus spelaei TaxID=2546320 RepID=A0A541B9W9_9NOCA|nr:hypothetical protein [Rhodococcus spelaei]TQF69141.1 hypothetical protein FK531_10250 [Rhodococcus spelaei]